jgi:putative spermidine/putrescine transport system permease protein
MTLQRILGLYIAMVCAILIAPIFIVAILAFSGESFLQFPPHTYSLRWFKLFFSDQSWIGSLVTSFEIAIIASVGATVPGFLAAYGLSRGTFNGKMSILVGLMIPMIVPSVVTSIAMYFFAVQLGTIGNLVWIALSHAVVALPVVVLIVLSALQGVDPNLERAARSLGASQARVVFKVVIPIASPGIISAALFSFLASFDELLISLFLTNVRAQTLPVRIWNSLEYNVEPIIAAVSTLLIAMTLVILAIDALLRGSSDPGREET